MLKTLHMPLSQKLSLASIFLIATVDVAFDILRTVYTVDGGAVAIDTIWDILEPTIAVMICALPTYRSVIAASASKIAAAYQYLQSSMTTRTPEGVAADGPFEMTGGLNKSKSVHQRHKIRGQQSDELVMKPHSEISLIGRSHHEGQAIDTSMQV